MAAWVLHTTGAPIFDTSDMDIVLARIARCSASTYWYKDKVGDFIRVYDKAVYYPYARCNVYVVADHHGIDVIIGKEGNLYVRDIDILMADKFQTVKIPVISEINT